MEYHGSQRGDCREMSYWGLILKSADTNLVGLKLYENVLYKILCKGLNTFTILIKSTMQM